MINTITYHISEHSIATELQAFKLGLQLDLGVFIGKVRFQQYIILGFRDDN